MITTSCQSQLSFLCARCGRWAIQTRTVHTNNGKYSNVHGTHLQQTVLSANYKAVQALELNLTLHPEPRVDAKMMTALC